MPAGRQSEVRRILIKADTQGDRNVKRLANQLGSMNKGVKSAADSLGFLKRALIGVTAGLGIREVARMSDSMELLNSRIRVLTTDGAVSEDILLRLKDAANEAKAPVDSLGEIYARLAAATKETGISSSLLIDLTKTLQNTFRLSGSTITESTSAAIQLSQGLASGQLRGQELRSVLEANVVVGDLLSKSFKVTRGELYKLAEAGQITANKVMIALFDSMDDVNSKAAQLGQTTEQTVTVAMNDLKFAIFDLNKELGLSSKFAEGISFISENIRSIGLLVTLLALTQLPNLIEAIRGVGTSLLLLNMNPIVATFTAFGAVLGLILLNVNPFVSAIADIQITFLKLGRYLSELDLQFTQFIDRIFGKTSTEAIQRSVDTINGYSRSIADLTAFQAKLREDSNKGAGDDLAKQLEERKKFIESLAKAGAGAASKLKDILAGINKEFLRTRDIGAYYEALRGFNFEKLNREFKEGKIDLEKYNQGLREISLQDLNQQLSSGIISFQKFNQATDVIKLAELNEKLQSGKINLQEYNQEFNKLQTMFNLDSAITQGVQDYLDSIGTLSDNIASGIVNTFSTLEDAFADFIKTGKFEFKDFANSIISELTRVIIRATIIRPLVQGLLGGVGGAAVPDITTNSSGATTLLAARGAAFDGGLKAFATGGIVNSPTMFGYGNGKSGIMGEAGPEAILPLSRGSSGNLGVEASVSPVHINIINNSGGEVESRETTTSDGGRQLDLIIHGKVKEGISSGAYDRLFKASYGLSRKGS